MKTRILIIEPYYGGSHKQFTDELIKRLSAKAEFHLLTLPARKWKMRMQLSAYWFVNQIKLLETDLRHFDTVLCSTFVDVSILRCELSKVEVDIRIAPKIPTITAIATITNILGFNKITHTFDILNVEILII